MNSGVYEILNTINGKRYVGSSKELIVRKKTHWNNLKADSHPNKYLQFAVNKYGLENFEFNVLEHCEEEYLMTLEQWYLDNRPWHYNLKSQAIGGGFKRDDVRKFEPQDVLDIIEMTTAGFTRKEISEHYECGKSTISHMVKRDTYKEVELSEDLIQTLEAFLKKNRHGRKFTCEEVQDVLQLSKSMKQIEIAAMYGASKPTIHEIIKNKSYQHCK